MVKSRTDLYSRLCSWENLILAARKAMRRKRSKPYVDTFWLNLEPELAGIRRELLDKSYLPGRYRHHWVHEPKRRFISAAPFRDRVVHHALCNLIEPVFERGFIADSYSCRVGKGTHEALRRCSDFLGRFRYFMKVDVREYFDSIDHGILMGMIARRIRCRPTLRLVRKIMDSHETVRDHSGFFPGDTLFTPYERRRGLPIGNLTSQLFANLYLDGFDHFVKERLRVKGYIRYTDDMVLFSNSKKELWRWRDRMAEYLESLRLRFNSRKTQVAPVKEGVEFLGFRLYPGRSKILPESIGRFRRRMKRLWRMEFVGAVDAERVSRSVLGWAAHAAHGHTCRLRQALYNEFSERSGADQLLRPGPAGRLLEQQR